MISKDTGPPKGSPLSNADTAVVTTEVISTTSLQGVTPDGEFGQQPATSSLSATNPTTPSGAWGDYLSIPQTKEEWQQLGITFLERKLAVQNALSEGIFFVPRDLEEVTPRLYKWFKAACVLTGTKIALSDTSVGTVKHLPIWSEDPLVAQSYLDSFSTDAKRAERRLMVSIIDFFQSLVRKTELPIREPTAGLFRSSALYVEVFNEKVHRIPRSVTAKDLNRSALKNQVLDQIKQLFVTDGIGALLMNLAEVLLCNVYKIVVEPVGTDYAQSLLQAIRPTVTVLAEGHYRRVTEKVKTAVRRGNRTVEELKDVVKIRPPSIRCSDKDVGSACSPYEFSQLKELNSLLTASRAKEQLEKLCDDSLRVQAEQVDQYVRRAYQLSDSVNSYMKSRNDKIRSMAVARAKDLIKKGEASDMKAAFTKELWDTCATEFHDKRLESKGSTLSDFLHSIYFLDDAERGEVDLDRMRRWFATKLDY